MNLETIELRWKQATESHEAMARYPAHAISDMAEVLGYVKQLEARIRYLELKVHPTKRRIYGLP